MSDAVEVISTSWYDGEVARLPADQRGRIAKRIDVLRQSTWSAALAHRMIAPLRDGIHELRVLGRGPAFRILFFLVPGRTPRLVVLAACVPKSMMKKRRLLDAELERTSTRREIWLEQEKLKEGR